MLISCIKRMILWRGLTFVSHVPQSGGSGLGASALWLIMIIAHVTPETRAESNDDMLRRSMLLTAKSHQQVHGSSWCHTFQGLHAWHDTVFLSSCWSPWYPVGSRPHPLGSSTITYQKQKGAASYTPNHRPRAFEACSATSSGAEEKSVWTSWANEISVDSMLRREGHLIYRIQINRS